VYFLRCFAGNEFCPINQHLLVWSLPSLFISPSGVMTSSSRDRRRHDSRDVMVVMATAGEAAAVSE